MPETRRAEAAAAPTRLLSDLRRLWRVPAAKVAGVTLATSAGVLAMVEPLLPLDLSDRLGLSSLAVGVVFAVGFAAYLLLVPLAGRWSDRRGRRAPIVLGGVLMAVGLPFIAVGPVGLVTVAFAVAGAGMAAMIAPSGPLMVEAVDDAGMRGRYGLSSAALTVIFALGYLVGPLLGAAASAVLPFLGDHDHRGGHRGRGHLVGRARPPQDEAAARGFGPTAKGAGRVALVASAATAGGGRPGERGLRCRCSRTTRPTGSSTRCSRGRTVRASHTGGSTPVSARCARPPSRRAAPWSTGPT